MRIQFYKKSGEKAQSVAYPKEMEVEISDQRILEYLRYLRHNQRRVIAKTKDRSEVSGTGAKPWRQKGTGRARHGSRRSPIWAGGGGAFGPNSDRNYKIKMNKKERQMAFLAILSAKIKNKSAMGVTDAKLSTPNTKTALSLIEKLPLKGNIGVVIPGNDQNWLKSFRNISFCKPMTPAAINGLDLLSLDSLLFTKESFNNLSAIYSARKKAKLIKKND